MRTHTFVVLALLVFVGAPALRAQRPGMQGASEFGEQEPRRAARKGRRWFISPSRNSPEEQLVYAGELAQRGRLSAASSAYRALVHRWHDTPEAVIAQESYARLLHERGRYRDAFAEYQYLMENYVGSFQYDQILRRQFAIASRVWERRSTHAFDFSGYSTQTALDMFKRIVDNAPNSEVASEALYMAGTILEKRREFELAVDTYERVRERYGQSPFAQDASFRRAVSLYELANLARRDEDRQKLAFRALSMFRREFPDSAHDAEAERKATKLLERIEELAYKRAVFYDRRRGRERAAIIAYERFLAEFPRSSRRDAVLERIRVLTKMTMPKDS